MGTLAVRWSNLILAINRNGLIINLIVERFLLELPMNIFFKRNSSRNKEKRQSLQKTLKVEFEI